MTQPRSRKARIEQILTDFALAVTQPHENWHELVQAGCFKKAGRRLSRLCTDEKQSAYEEILRAIFESDEDELEEGCT